MTPICAQAAGVRIIPRPASGRPRAGIRADQGRLRRGLLVTALRSRRTREVYRLYEEQAFLGLADHAEDPAADAAGVGNTLEAGSLRLGERRFRRLAGTAIAVGAVGAVGCLVASSTTRSLRSAAQRRVGGPRAVVAPATSIAGGAVQERRKTGVARRSGASRRHGRESRSVGGRASSPSVIVSAPGAIVPAARANGVGRAEFGFERGAGS